MGVIQSEAGFGQAGNGLQQFVYVQDCCGGGGDFCHCFEFNSTFGGFVLGFADPGEGAGILDGYGDLACQGRLQAHVSLGKAVNFVRLHIQHADQVLADDHRDCHFRAGFGQIRIWQKVRGLSYVVGDHAVTVTTSTGDQRVDIFERNSSSL